MGCGSSIKKEVKRTGRKVEAEASRTGENIEKGATAVAAAASDPTTWVAYMSGVPGGAETSTAMGAKKAQEAWDAMSQAERDEANAEADRMKAMNEEQRLQAVAKRTQAEQAKMVRDREAKATASAAERAKRLGTGRRGLLFQGEAGKETGVKSKVLGG